MALTFDVVRQTSETGGYSQGSADDSLTTDFSVGYDVTISDPADQNFDPRNVGVFEVLAAPGLPIVNQSVYYNNGLIIPYLVCRRKTAKRDPARRDRWNVSTTWNTGTRANSGELTPKTPPPALTDFTPLIETQLGQDDIVRYTDKDGKDCLTPTKNFYDSPFIELIATEIRRVTQYESFISYQQMRDRKFKMNSVVYRGEPINSWFMTQVEAIETTVELAAGPVLAAQVTYTMQFTDRPNLWLEERSLQDSHYYDAGEKLPFYSDDLKTLTIGKVDAAGAKLASTAPMEYDSWKMQDAIDFNGFLLA